MLSKLSAAVAVSMHHPPTRKGLAAMRLGSMGKSGLVLRGLVFGERSCKVLKDVVALLIFSSMTTAFWTTNALG